MSRSKAPIAFGALAAGGIGYYLYSAGGDPKAAQHKAEGTFSLLFFSFSFYDFLPRASFSETMTREKERRRSKIL